MTKASNKRRGDGRNKVVGWVPSGRKNPRKKNPQTNPELPAAAQACIHDLLHDGRGVARVNDRTVFVAGALPDETVALRYIARRGKFDEAVVTELLTPSKFRIEAQCPHFKQCGGCQLQYLQPAQQTVFKQQQMLAALQRLGKIVPQRVLEPLSSSPWHYRRRARLGVRYIPQEDRVVLGFRQAGSDRIEAISECRILMAPFSHMMPLLAALVSALKVKKRVPQVELLVGDKGSGVNFHILADLGEEDRHRLLMFGEQHQLKIYCQSQGVDTVVALNDKDEGLLYHLPKFNLDVEFLPSSFLQVNATLNESLIDKVLELLQLQGSEQVLDLFCGLGNFTLPLACRAAQVVGVEGNARAVAMAEKNAQRNNLDNTEFYVADLSDVQRDRRWQNKKYDAIVLDPPRSGAADIIPFVGKSGAKRVVYVSCHPGSLARDVGELVAEYGYTVTCAGVVDMFPQTSHVESIVLLSK